MHAQPVWGQAEHCLEQARLRAITRCVKPGSVETGARVAIVEELARNLVPILAGTGAQQLEL